MSGGPAAALWALATAAQLLEAVRSPGRQRSRRSSRLSMMPGGGAPFHRE